MRESTDGGGRLRSPSHARSMSASPASPSTPGASSHMRSMSAGTISSPTLFGGGLGQMPQESRKTRLAQEVPQSVMRDPVKTISYMAETARGFVRRMSASVSEFWLPLHLAAVRGWAPVSPAVVGEVAGSLALVVSLHERFLLTLARNTAHSAIGRAVEATVAADEVRLSDDMRANSFDSAGSSDSEGRETFEVNSSNITVSDADIDALDSKEDEYDIDDGVDRSKHNATVDALHDLLGARVDVRKVCATAVPGSTAWCLRYFLEYTSFSLAESDEPAGQVPDRNIAASFEQVYKHLARRRYFWEEHMQVFLQRVANEELVPVELLPPAQQRSRLRRLRLHRRRMPHDMDSKSLRQARIARLPQHLIPLGSWLVPRDTTRSPPFLSSLCIPLMRLQALCRLSKLMVRQAQASRQKLQLLRHINARFVHLVACYETGVTAPERARVLSQTLTREFKITVPPGSDEFRPKSAFLPVTQGASVLLLPDSIHRSLEYEPRRVNMTVRELSECDIDPTLVKLSTAYRQQRMHELVKIRKLPLNELGDFIFDSPVLKSDSARVGAKCRFLLVFERGIAWLSRNGNLRGTLPLCTETRLRVCDNLLSRHSAQHQNEIRLRNEKIQTIHERLQALENMDIAEDIIRLEAENRRCKEQGLPIPHRDPSMLPKRRVVVSERQLQYIKQHDRADRQQLRLQLQQLFRTYLTFPDFPVFMVRTKERNILVQCRNTRIADLLCQTVARVLDATNLLAAAEKVSLDSPVDATPIKTKLIRRVWSSLVKPRGRSKSNSSDTGSAFRELAEQESMAGPLRAISRPFSVQRSKLLNADLEWQGQSIDDLVVLGGMLGKGGFGEVYSGHHKRLQSVEVAVKKIMNALTDAGQKEQQSEASFENTGGDDCDERTRQLQKGVEREMKILRAAQHPNVTAFFGHVLDKDGVLWIFMELCKGGTLSTVMRDARRPLCNIELAAVAAELVTALDYLHNKAHILHRDIKASNVLIGADGRVKLADFGVSKILKKTPVSRKHKIQPSIVGSPFWMAPEAARAQPATTACDIWSLGITLIELVRGRPPLAGQNKRLMMILREVARGPPPRLLPDELDGFRKPIEPGLIDLVAQCLQMDPKKRPTAEELLEHPFVRLGRKRIAKCSLRDAERVASFQRMGKQAPELPYVDCGSLRDLIKQAHEARQRRAQLGEADVFGPKARRGKDGVMSVADSVAIGPRSRSPRRLAPKTTVESTVQESRDNTTATVTRSVNLQWTSNPETTSELEALRAMSLRERQAKLNDWRLQLSQATDEDERNWLRLSIEKRLLMERLLLREKLLSKRGDGSIDESCELSLQQRHASLHQAAKRPGSLDDYDEYRTVIESPPPMRSVVTPPRNTTVRPEAGVQASRKQTHPSVHTDSLTVDGFADFSTVSLSPVDSKDFDIENPEFYTAGDLESSSDEGDL